MAKDFDAKYNVSVAEASRELNARERIQFKDTGNAIPLDGLSRDAQCFINDVVDYVVLHIENDKSDDKEYDNYLIITDDGQKYVTGSRTFWRTFKDIWDELRADGDHDPFNIAVYQTESKNYKGKKFISCSLV